MSAHYSRWDLYTFSSTPYFQSQVPADYPLPEVLQGCRMHRRLPPNLRLLSMLARQWAVRQYGHPQGVEGIERWYDESGAELDPDTLVPLTEAEVDRSWEGLGIPLLVDPEDVPVPKGGFADPGTWSPPPPPRDDAPDPDLPTRESLLRDVRSHGREYVARDYEVDPSLPEAALVEEILSRLG